MSLRLYFQTNTEEQPDCTHQIVVRTRTKFSNESVAFESIDAQPLNVRLCDWWRARGGARNTQKDVTVWLSAANQYYMPTCIDCCSTLDTGVQLGCFTIGGYC